MYVEAYETLVIHQSFFKKHALFCHVCNRSLYIVLLKLTWPKNKSFYDLMQCSHHQSTAYSYQHWGLTDMAQETMHDSRKNGVRVFSARFGI